MAKRYQAAYNHPVYRAARKRLHGLPCVVCGLPADTIDHIVSLADGGTNEPSNFQPMCRAENSAKGGVLGGTRRRAKRSMRAERNSRYR